jgi:hypothetical protein
MKVISLSHNEPGTACSISVAIKKFIYNDDKPPDFFDFLLVSMRSVNEVLLGKELDFIKNQDEDEKTIKFKNFHHMLPVHDLENIKKNNRNSNNTINELIEKYNRRRQRLLDDIKSNDTIYFVRFCTNITNIEESEISHFLNIIKNINQNLKVHFILVTCNYRQNQTVAPLNLLKVYPNIKMLYLDNYLSEKENELNYSFITNETIKLTKFDEFVINLKPISNFIHNIENNLNKNAVVILTRGYTEYEKYFSLIQRNKSINKNLNDKTIDIVIFNEGNISDIHKQRIKEETPELNIKFVTISEKAFLKENEVFTFYKTTIRDIWHYGYRHMCHFWFIDFLHFCNNYDYILRIDEDCIIDFNIDEIFKILPSKFLIAGAVDSDGEHVTRGMNKFTLDFLKKNGFNMKPKEPGGPYTNIFALNLLKLHKNQFLKVYMNYVDKSNNIYIYRWGDLPLWGEVLEYFYKKYDYLIYNKINYYHGSLGKYVNKITNTIVNETTNLQKMQNKTLVKQQIIQNKIRYLNNKNKTKNITRLNLL